jgi:hypothetical protein
VAISCNQAGIHRRGWSIANAANCQPPLKTPEKCRPVPEGPAAQGSAQPGTTCSLAYLLKVQCHIGQLLLDVTHNLTLSSGGEGVATLCRDAPNNHRSSDVHTCLASWCLHVARSP